MVTGRSCLLIAILATTNAFAGLDVVRDGRPVAMIVLPDKPSPTERLAAEELQGHVKLISGAELPIRSDATQGPRVLIGRAAAEVGVAVNNLELEHYRIRTGPNWLAIAGRDGVWHPKAKEDPFDVARTCTGTLFGVYRLLDDELGVRWIWPGESGTVVPSRKTIRVGDLDVTGGPELIQRQMRSPRSQIRRRDKFIEFDGVTLRPQEEVEYWAREEVLWLRRHRIGRRKQFGFGHAFGSWWSKYSKSHPEYFATLPDGKKQRGGKNVKLCVSNPAVIDQLIEDWKMAGAGEMVRACPNDGRSYCVCPKCRAMDLPVKTTPETVDASVLTYRYVRWWNRIAERVEAINPKAWVCGYAYSNYRTPPQGVKLRPNIILGYTAGISSMPRGGSYDVYEDWKGWSEAGASLFFRPNWFHAGHLWPYLPLHQAGEFFQFARSHGMQGTDFDSILGHWSTQGAYYYLMARLHVRPQKTVAQALDEYVSAFGSAAPEVRAYLKYWEDFTLGYRERFKAIQEKYGRKIGAGRRVYIQAMPYLFTEDVMEPAHQLLDRAAGKVANDPPKVRARVEFLRLGLEHVRKTTAAVKAVWTDAGRKGVDPMQSLAAVQALRAFRKKNAPTGFDWTEFSDAWEIRAGDYTGLRLTAALGDRTPLAALPTAWWFQWDPEKIGLEQKWYADSLDPRRAGWARAHVNRPWEKQDVGRRWAEQHDGEDYNGVAWYRTEFGAPQEAKSKKVILLFGAVDESCKVWLNGELVGEHLYTKPDDWKTPFEIDITPAVRFDRKNRVAVWVEDNSGAGGIWKLVWLLAE